MQNASSKIKQTFCTEMLLTYFLHDDDDIQLSFLSILFHSSNRKQDDNFI